MNVTEQICPQNWRVRSLDSLGKVVSGATPSTRVSEFWNGDISWITPADLSQQRTPFISVTERSISQKGLKSCAASLIPRQNIVISSRAPIGYIAIPTMDFATNQGCKSLLLNEKQNYLFHYYNLNFHVRKLREQGEGTTFAEISKTALEEVQVPVPETEAVQATIGEILLSVDQAIERTLTLIEKRERIKIGLMSDLLTRGLDRHGHLRRAQIDAPDLYQSSPLGCIPKDWEVGELGREIGPIISGWSPNCEPLPAGANEWAVLKTTAVVWDGYRDTENKRLPDNLNPVRSLEVEPNDILITRKGPVERVGVVVHVAQTRPRLMIPDTVFKLRLRPNGKVASAFLPLALASASVQRDWFGKKIGLADAQVDINHGIVRGTLFPLPPPSEQEKIILAFESIRAESMALKKELGKYERIKNGLAHDLLTGLVSVEKLVATQAVAGQS